MSLERHLQYSYFTVSSFHTDLFEIMVFLDMMLRNVVTYVSEELLPPSAWCKVLHLTVAGVRTSNHAKGGISHVSKHHAVEASRGLWGEALCFLDPDITC
jgi:hypothetical protein